MAHVISHGNLQQVSFNYRGNVVKARVGRELRGQRKKIRDITEKPNLKNQTDTPLRPYTLCFHVCCGTILVPLKISQHYLTTYWEIQHVFVFGHALNYTWFYSVSRFIFISFISYFSYCDKADSQCIIINKFFFFWSWPLWIINNNDIIFINYKYQWP